MEKLYFQEESKVTRSLQCVVLFVGFLLLGLGWYGPRFRNAEGFLAGEFCLLLAISMALILLGLAGMGRYQKVVFWCSVGLIGQAVALQLIEAGPAVRYQHYKPFPRLLTDSLPLLTLLTVQSLIVAYGFRMVGRTIKNWVTQSFDVWQLVGIGTIFSLTSATVSHEFLVYGSELLFAVFIQTVNVANIVLIVWSFPHEALMKLKEKANQVMAKGVRGTLNNSVRIEPIVLLLTGWVIVFSALLNILTYEQHPHLQDEVAYLYQARFFAQGVLTLPVPAVPEAFENYLMQYQDGRWFFAAPPGWPAMLAVGVYFGVPWLVNPLLAGLNIILAYIFLQEVYGRRIARISIFLLSVSPWNLFMAMNFMPHTFTLSCTLLALVSLAWARRTGKVKWGWVSGGAVGIVSLIRPLDGVIVAVALGLWALGLGGRRLKSAVIIGLIFGTIFVGMMVFPYNKLLTEDPFVFPIMAYTDQHFAPKANAYGFGPERGMGWPLDPYPGHGPVDGLINANLNAFSVNVELFGWSTGSLIFFGLFLVSRRYQDSDFLMFVIISIVFIAYFFYYFSGGPDFGARYWFLMVIPLVALTARGIEELSERIARGSAYSSVLKIRVMMAIIFLSALSLINFIPWRAIDKYHHYLNMRGDIPHLAQKHDFGKSLVLIRGNQFPDYASAAAYNPLNINDSNSPVYAWYRNEEIANQTINAYPNRPIWVIEGPTVTGQGYRVAQSPALLDSKGQRDIFP